MTDDENVRFIECSDDRFEIIAKAKRHIIEATNIEMSPKEMEVLDNFLFRCWQMHWLKNDYRALEKENKPKWHEIKYCSQDLPPRSKDNHLHSVIVSNEYGEPIYYDYNIDEWFDMEGDVVSEGYKYWCELPRFEE